MKTNKIGKLKGKSIIENTNKVVDNPKDWIKHRQEETLKNKKRWYYQAHY